MTLSSDPPKPEGSKSQPKPASPIDLQAVTTFPHISSEYISDRLKNKFRTYKYVCDKDGNILLDDKGNPRVQLVADSWTVMEAFTQDWRLANSSKEEQLFIRHNLDLFADIMICLPAAFADCSLIALERSICLSETSQGRGGFLRRMFNSFFSSSSSRDETPQKRTFLGMGKRKEVS